MCNFVDEELEKTQFTGYKIAVKRKGKYYSIATLIEYKPGKVPIAKKLKKSAGYGLSNVTDPYNMAYKSQYRGMTAVFVSLEEAKQELEYFAKFSSNPEFSSNVVLLKMTIQKTKDKNCWHGSYSGLRVYIGPKIRKITELKTN